MGDTPSKPRAAVTVRYRAKNNEVAEDELLRARGRHYDRAQAARRARLHLRYCEHMAEAVKACDPSWTGTVASAEHHIMLVALGWSRGRDGRQRVGGWRNHYATDQEHWAWDLVALLVCDRYMAWVPARLEVSDRHVAMVTLAGMRHLRAHGYAVTDAWECDE